MKQTYRRARTRFSGLHPPLNAPPFPDRARPTGNLLWYQTHSLQARNLERLPAVPEPLPVPVPRSPRPPNPPAPHRLPPALAPAPRLPCLRQPARPELLRRPELRPARWLRGRLRLRWSQIARNSCLPQAESFPP